MSRKLIQLATVLIVTVALAAGALVKAESGSVVEGTVLNAAGQPVVNALVQLKGTDHRTTTDTKGYFRLQGISPGSYQLVVTSTAVGRVARDINVAKNSSTVTLQLTVTGDALLDSPSTATPEEKELTSRPQPVVRTDEASDKARGWGRVRSLYNDHSVGLYAVDSDRTYAGGEQYDHINENNFYTVYDKPVSTFGVDVDAASYANTRRFLTDGSLPPVDAVRVEELINYFDYNYPSPRGNHPFSIVTEVAESPWSPGNQLVHIGVQGERLEIEDLPPSNLVFLIDVSGSMNSRDKLPLLKKAFRMATRELREEDTVSIVVYAGAAGLVLPPTSGADKTTILRAINQLSAGGSTAGGAGIKLAYRLAQDNFKRRGNNRVILATDGDFNVGVSSDGELVRLIETKRKSGVFLTVLGFGTGNLKDSKMKKLANKGNGHYAYIDSPLEARRVMVSQLGGTLQTIAKDVKIQVAFNPAYVEAYRLIGYENRVLAARDFNNDRKDAGDIGAGHSVTALYEIVPRRGIGSSGSDNPYLKDRKRPQLDDNGELMTVRFRYKQPNASKSRLIEQKLDWRHTDFHDASESFRFAAAVAEFGMLLRDSEHVGEGSFDQVIAIAEDSSDFDPDGYRVEFIGLVERAAQLDGRVSKHYPKFRR